MDFTIVGMDLYHIIVCFFLYCMLGWLVESIYMSYCEKRIVNRGFAKGPFCPIYGMGAIGGVIFFNPIKDNYLLLYVVGCVVATFFEYLVGLGMINILGELWWDYRTKPLQYKGILCAESTLAWGFYAIGILHFLHPAVMSFVDRFDRQVGWIFVGIVIPYLCVDYFFQIRKAITRKKEKTVAV